MSERALGFVEEWISDHIATQGGVSASVSVPDDGRAAMLAKQCQADAAAQGISQAEISESIDDLASFIAGAIQEADERREHAAQDEPVAQDNDYVKGADPDDDAPQDATPQNDNPIKTN
jgi:hypothetical protein